MDVISTIDNQAQNYLNIDKALYDTTSLPLEKGKKYPVNSISEEKAVSDFESLFIHFLIKSMRKTVIKSDLMHQTRGEDIYESMFDMEIAKEMSKQNNGIGLKSLISSGFRQRENSTGKHIDIK